MLANDLRMVFGSAAIEKPKFTLPFYDQNLSVGPQKTFRSRLRKWIQKRIKKSSLPITKLEAAKVFGVHYRYSPITEVWKEFSNKRLLTEIFADQNRAALEKILEEFEENEWRKMFPRWNRPNWIAAERIPIDIAFRLRKKVLMSVSEMRADYAFLNSFMSSEEARDACRHIICAIVSE